MIEDVFYHKVSKNYHHIDFPLSKEEAKKFQLSLKEWNNIGAHRYLPVLQYDNHIEKYPDGKKKKVKTRTISLVSHHDTGVYALFAELLNDRYNQFMKNNGIDDVSVAYRTVGGKSNITVANEMFRYIDQQEESWVFKGDFKGFFDNLNHVVLKQNFNKVIGSCKSSEELLAWRKMIMKLCSFEYIDEANFLSCYYSQGYKLVRRGGQSAFFPDLKSYGKFIKKNEELVFRNSKRGIPQGTPISGVAANVYMINFDNEVTQIVSRVGGVYRRYSDDFIIVIPKKYICKNEFTQLASQIVEMSENLVHLTIEDHKTKKIYVSNNNVQKLNGKETSLDYLGFTLYNNTVSFRPKSIYKFLYRGKRFVLSAQIAQETYEILRQLKKRTNGSLLSLGKTNLWEFVRKKQSAQKIFDSNKKKQEADQNRVWHIAQRADKGMGLPEVKKSQIRYLWNTDRSNPRESFGSYVKLATKIFSEKQGYASKYKINFEKQASKARRKFGKR